MDLRTGIIIAGFILFGAVGFIVVLATGDQDAAKPVADIDHYNEGLRAFGEGDFPQAIRLFKKVVAENPANRDAILYTARSYDRVGKFPSAIDYYDQYIRLAPGSAEVLEAIGICQYKQAFASRKIEQAFLELARVYFEKALALDETRLGSGFYLGHVHRLKREFEKAEQQLLKTAAFNPNNKRVHGALLKLYRDRKDTEKANRQLEILKRLDATSWKQENKDKLP